MEKVNNDESCFLSGHIKKLILDDFENYLINGKKCSKAEEDSSSFSMSKLFSKLIFDKSNRILKWYKKYRSFFILGIYDVEDPYLEKLIFILNSEIITAYKSISPRDIRYSVIANVDPINELNPLVLLRDHNKKNKYYLNYKSRKISRVVEIEIDSESDYLYISNIFDTEETTPTILENVQQPHDVFFRNLTVETEKDFVSVLNDIPEPMEVIWTGLLEYPDLGGFVDADGATITTELNIPIMTEVKSLYEHDGYLHIITREKALSDVKKYIKTLNDNNDLSQRFRIVSSNYYKNTLPVMIILNTNLYQLRDPMILLCDSISFTPVRVSHPFAVDFGLHIVGLDPA
jgi:hypothetical protein